MTAVGRRLVVVGASPLQRPAILAAREMGLRVAVVDQNPDAVGVADAHEFFPGSTRDESVVLSAARTFGAHGVMTLATDWPMRGVALAADTLHLPGISYEAAVRATDKAAMAQAFRDHGIPHPASWEVSSRRDIDDLLPHLTFPVVTKPVDGSGSIGVTAARDRQELRDAFDASIAAARNGRVLVQTRVSGPEISIELVFVNGRAHAVAVTDKRTTGPPHFVEEGHSQPSRHPTPCVERAVGLAARAAAALGVDHGTGHAEIMLTEQGPVMIEFGARMGGDRIATDLVRLSTGVDMTELAIRAALGDPVRVRPTLSRGAAIRFLTATPGIVTGVAGIDRARRLGGVVDVDVTAGIGDEVRPLQSSADRVGHVIATGPDAAAATSAADAGGREIIITTDEHAPPG